MGSVFFVVSRHKYNHQQCSACNHGNHESKQVSNCISEESGPNLLGRDWLRVESQLEGVVQNAS